MLTGDDHPALLDRSRSAVLVIDMQDAFRPWVGEFFAISENIRLLLAGAALLDVPVAASEQYPEGLGETSGDIGLAPDAPKVAKLEFAACAAPAWESLPESIRDAEQFVLVGLEAHVCVRHTALALLADGRTVHVAADAVASHTSMHRDVALRALARAGAHVGTVEQVLFDWLGAAGTPAFREVQRLLTARGG